MAFTRTDGVEGSADTYRGTSGVDELGLIASNAWVGAQPGNDRVAFAVGEAGGSNYTVNGGAGNDTFFEQGSTNLTNSVLKADDGNDIITLSGTLRSTISGGVGVDQISTSGMVSSSLINGNQDDDTIRINAGATSSSIYGGIGQDAINLTTDITSTTVRGNEGNDIFDIAAGTFINSAVINGNQGNDLITINAISAFTNTTIFGGGDNDTINAATSAVGVVATGDSGIDSLNGGTAADSLTGSAGNDSFTGGTGNDNFVVDADTDSVLDFGTGGGDEILTTAGATAALSVLAANTVTATSVNNGTINALTVVGTQLAADSTISFAALTGSQGVTLSAATQAGNRVFLTGSAQSDTITGGGGADTITAGAGNNSLTGGAGNEDFSVGAGTTAITDFGVGGSGEDIVAVAGATVNATLLAANTVSAASDNTGGIINVSTDVGTQLADNSVINFDLITGNTGVTVNASSQTALNGVQTIGSDFGDTITGGASEDTLTGGTGADNITGGAANDSFVQASTTDSGLLTAGGGATATTALDVFTVNAGDTVSIVGSVDVAGTYDTLTAIVEAGNLSNTVVAGNVQQTRGIYNGNNNTFTVATNGAGANAVMINFDDAAAGTDAAQSIVLSGVTALTSVTNGIITV